MIIAIVSGKGGVGKTMLSVAIANELARSVKTILLDLDFFNRGLTGLFSSIVATSRREEVEPPRMFHGSQGDNRWYLVKVANNLYTISYGEIDRSSSDVLETTDIGALSEALSDFIKRLREASGCAIVILDCHGGPDNTSFAACMIANHTILVSEPDKITLYGTLNFIRRLRSTTVDHTPDIRLVFNKVVAAFSSRFLFRFYKTYLQDDFNGHDLLAVYPLEAHLTKAFEHTPFLTAVYPTSQLAQKTRFLLYELLGHETPTLLPRAISNPSRMSRIFHRYYMGNWPRIFNPQFILKVIAIVSIVIFGIPALIPVANTYMPVNMQLPLLPTVSPESMKRPLNQFSVIGLFFLWLILSSVFNWMRDLDIFLTYSFRTKSFWGAGIGCLTFTVLCMPFAMLVGAMLMVPFRAFKVSMLSFGDIIVYVLLSVIFILPAWPLVKYLMRGIRNIRFDRRYAEGGFRITFSFAISAVGAYVAYRVS